MRFIATCKIGLESVVALELRRLGIEVERVEDAKVTFAGELETMAKACLWLRTAERVLMEINSFEARSFEELFQGVRTIHWSDYIKRDSFIHVNGKSAKSTLFSVSDCQRIAKKAIVESLMSAYHMSADNNERLPETGKEMIIEVGILRDVVTVALDCCGAGLSRRGYRTYNVAAPLAETLGAGILLLSHYRADRPLMDPMCGSGTMPIEAAMMANNIAPGLGRPFAAEKWDFAQGAELFERARQEARDSRIDAKADILGSDIDARSIDLCKKHAKKAGVMVNWRVAPLKELQSDKSGGLIACNPPYGERMMEKREAEALYREMRRKFDELDNWQVSVITAYREFEKVYGKRADKRRKLSNGGMTCTLYQYFRQKD